mgnify:CR=1 FL=1
MRSEDALVNLGEAYPHSNSNQISVNRTGVRLRNASRHNSTKMSTNPVRFCLRRIEDRESYSGARSPPTTRELPGRSVQVASPCKIPSSRSRGMSRFHTCRVRKLAPRSRRRKSNPSGSYFAGFSSCANFTARNAHTMDGHLNTRLPNPPGRPPPMRPIPQDSALPDA